MAAGGARRSKAIAYTGEDRALAAWYFSVSPVGDQLSHIIGEKLRIKFEGGNRQTSGNKLIMEALRRHASANQQDANLYRRAAFGVAGGIAYSRSIDSYLHAHKDNKPLQRGTPVHSGQRHAHADDDPPASLQLRHRGSRAVCGKLAIAQTILEHEKGSALVLQTGQQFRNPTKANESWLGAFMYGLQERIVVNENRYLQTSDDRQFQLRPVR